MSATDGRKLKAEFKAFDRNKSALLVSDLTQKEKADNVEYELMMAVAISHSVVNTIIDTMIKNSTAITRQNPKLV